MRMRKTTFSFFLALTLTSLFSFLLEWFTTPGLDEEQFLFLFFDLFYLPCLLVEEVSGLSNTLFAGSSNELSAALLFFFTCPITAVNYRREHLHHADLYAESQHFIFTVLNICYYIIFPCSLPVVRPTPFRFANKVDKKSMEDWDPH